MHLWHLSNWSKNDSYSSSAKKGMRLHIENGVPPTVRKAYVLFARWLRREFQFPVRVNVYIKKDYRIRAKDGDYVVGTFWEPFDYSSYPYIRLATGGYDDLCKKDGTQNAVLSLFDCFAHELTHYYQYINGLALTDQSRARQAKYYATKIIGEYQRHEATQSSIRKE